MRLSKGLPGDVLTGCTGIAVAERRFHAEGDRLARAVAVAVLGNVPYLHAKPRSDLVAKAPYQMTDSELREVLAAEEEHQR
jgi:hypothetical protein